MKPNKLKKYLEKQRQLIIETYQRLSLVEEIAPAEKPAWTAKEIIGHLIDSASNNHQRFVRAQFAKDLVVPGYDQDKWVAVQAYQEADWVDLVTLWTSYNLMLTHVISCIPNEILTKKFEKHNLHKTAFKPVPANEPVTLEYFIKDYYAHMQHHLKRVKKLTVVNG